MRTIARMTAVALALTACLSLPAQAYAPGYTKTAETLEALGLFAGTEEGYRLDKDLTRVEGAVLLIRLLGKEREAADEYAAGTVAHPFTDIPAWAAAQVAWLYTHKLVSGQSPSRFGTGRMSAQEFATFVLRALGHTDFVWSAALDKALDIGLLTAAQRAELLSSFRRDQAVLLVYNALSAPLSGSPETLIEKLRREGAVTVRQVRLSGDATLAALLNVPPLADAPIGVEPGCLAFDFSYTQPDGGTGYLYDHVGPVLLYITPTAAASELAALRPAAEAGDVLCIVPAARMPKLAEPFTLGGDDGTVTVLYGTGAKPMALTIAPGGVIFEVVRGALTAEQSVTLLDAVPVG